MKQAVDGHGGARDQLFTRIGFIRKEAVRGVELTIDSVPVPDHTDLYTILKRRHVSQGHGRREKNRR